MRERARARSTTLSPTITTKTTTRIFGADPSRQFTPEGGNPIARVGARPETGDRSSGRWPWCLPEPRGSGSQLRIGVDPAIPTAGGVHRGRGDDHAPVCPKVDVREGNGVAW